MNGLKNHGVQIAFRGFSYEQGGEGILNFLRILVGVKIVTGAGEENLLSMGRQIPE